MITAAVSMLFLGQLAVDARLMRFPAIYEGTVIFTYAGDLWTVPEAGGIARRLTSHPGAESLAKFSPDGKQVAFTGNYDGNTDVYVMPAEGGEPKRLTFHPDADITVGWTPDGKNILFRSTRTSVSGRYQKLFMINSNGGTPKELPMDECGLASPSPDGTVYAYNRVATENAAWKRYRGGLQSFISFYDVRNNKYWEMPHNASAYLWPMWVDNRVFYCNDSDGRYNLYSYDTETKKSKKLTTFNDFDVKWPSYGSGKIVFERDAKLWTYTIASGEIKNIPVRIMSDLLEARPYRMNLGDRVGDVTISPNGGRVALEARGELFDVPAKEGLTYNFTKTPGARERFPRWSPDGKWILFTSDKTGEYEFYTQKASDMSASATQITVGGQRFRTAGAWSPDSKKFFYRDTMNTLYIVDVATKQETKVGRGEYPAYDDAVWSPDSKWLAYSKSTSTEQSQLYVYNVAEGKETKLTESFFNDANPMFDAESKYLFFVSMRDFNPTTGALELSFNVADGQRIYGYTLNKSLPSPFAPKNEDIGEEKGQTDTNPALVDFTNLEGRLFILPMPPGQYTLQAAGTGKLFYSSGNSLFAFDLNAKKALPVMENVSQFAFTPKADKLAYISGNTVGVIPVQPGQPAAPGAGKVDTSNMDAQIEPRAEWKQSYWEAWRYERDFFWTATMGGLDWRAIGEKYARWLPYVAHRSDLDYLLRELLGELATGHAYVIPGFTGGGRQVPIGLLGADFEAIANGVRLKKIYRGNNWDASARSPLNEPGLNIKEGDYLLAIDGDKVTPNTNVEELLVGKANKIVELTINSSASMTGARKVLVRTIGSEGGLRYADWVQNRWQYVQDKTGGRVAYVHVPSTGIDGVIQFYKMFYPQVDKDAIIIDERYNSGGYIPDFFIEKLGRTDLVRWTPRNLGDFRSPGAAVLGPKVMLINNYAGSGGDAFPYFFKKRGLGPIIGTRTWGGLVGIQGVRDLMSGGGVTVPQFAIWDVDERGVARWVVENQGVSPDIEIDNRPDLVRAGQDPQLDKAIEVIMEALRKKPAKKVPHPSFPGLSPSPR